MARPLLLSALDETPVRINSGLVTEVQTIFAHNPSEVSGAYVKLYAGASTPVVGTVPIFAAWIPPGAAGSGGAERVLPVFAGAAQLWIAVATQAGAGLTAPAADFAVSLTFAG